MDDYSDMELGPMFVRALWLCNADSLDCTKVADAAIDDVENIEVCDVFDDENCGMLLDIMEKDAELGIGSDEDYYSGNIMFYCSYVNI